MKRKILYVSGTRADYGLMRSVLFRINNNPGLELHIAATGMHLMPEFGNTVNEISKDGFSCHRVDVTYEQDTKESMALFIGAFIQRFVRLAAEIRPDIILLLGDRGEQLGAAIAGAYLAIPVAHIHGGEVTATADESARHAITKLAHIHLPATEGSAKRIIKMGEDPKNVFVVGAPGIDEILNLPPAVVKEVADQYAIDPSVPLILVIQHPVPLEPGDPAARMEETMKAVSGLPHLVFVIYPNADAGGRAMIDVIKKYASHKNIRAFRSIGHDEFLAILKLSSVIVGNSSSAIIEAPSFGVPAINIGTRQNGREKGKNVIDTGYHTGEIAAAINRALQDERFKRKVKTAINPYGTGNSSEKITGILEKIRITPELLQKRMMY
jgi:GDP/UDP-N,N'-diacetylbacillosamine 2-epimerase (hydrolysing)